MAYLELRGLTKRYGPIAAVESFSLNIEQGEFVSLLGPSGCGKTTTLQMIAGFETPTSGEIKLGGLDLSGVPARQRGLGIVFQTYALFPHMTVAQNVAFGLEMRKVAKADRRKRVAAALDLVHLSHLEDRYPRAMSGGQRQRVALARALVVQPQLLLLDEPLSNLDAQLREEMQFELRRIQQEAGVTTVMVTHDQAEAMALSDRVAVMRDGHLIQEATPFDVYENPQTSFISNFLGKSNSLEGELRREGGMKILLCNGVRLGDASKTDKPDGAVLISLRPERIEFVSQADAIVSGTVAECIFRGDQWLFKVSTGLGDILVMRRNSGIREAKTGETVYLSWRGQDLRVMSVGRAA
jgi:putative spermidine/putrescine transport system ATP-binding protein